MKIKDVVLEKSNWKQTRQSLSHVSDAGNSSNVYSTYAAAYNQTSPYYNYSSSYGNYYALSGFAKDIDEIVEISKSIRDLIDSQDEDGVCHYSYNDEVSVARNVQGKLDTLMRYACQAEKEIENQIDHKFYEEIDKVFYNLEQLQIQNYKTKNIIGYQRKETITDEYGQTVEYMVIPEDVSITDLYSVDNIYSEQLKDEYKEYKAYYSDIEISESDYLVSILNSRYFNYDSLYEQQIHVENIRDWLLLGVTIITGIVCPPVAFAIGFGFGVLEVGSLIAGRDYLSGRKMETGERIQRGIFGALDMLPGVVVIAKQFEYGRKILNTVGKLKAKALNFVKDTYDIGKSKLTSAYNSLITKIDDFENSIIRQIDDAFVGNSRLRPAFAGIPNNNFDDVISNSNKAVKFSNQAFSKADDAVKIFSGQADDVLESTASKNIDDIVKTDFQNLTKEEYLEKYSKEQYYECLRNKYGVNRETKSIIGNIDEIDLEDIDDTYRRTYLETENELGTDFIDHKSQQSFIDNGPTDEYGLKGSIRVDGYNKDIDSVVEFKNYNVQNAQGRSNLANNIKKQYKSRVDGLPPGTSQKYILDIRGQNVNFDDLKKLSESILQKTDGQIELLFKIK